MEIDARVRSSGVTFGFEREASDGDGVVAGYGTIDGRPVYVAAQDPEVHGGSIGRMHAGKIAKVIRLAIQARAPFIGMYDSGGARIEEGVLALDGMAEVLGALDAASGDIPTIAAVMGPCAGGLAVAAAQSDFVLMCGSRAGLYMNGPAVVAASERKTLDPSVIGGAAVHTVETGLAAFAYENEAACAAGIRQLLGYLPDSADAPVFPFDGRDDANRTDDGLDRMAEALDAGYDNARRDHIGDGHRFGNGNLCGICAGSVHRVCPVDRLQCRHRGERGSFDGCGYGCQNGAFCPVVATLFRFR